jgi:Uma2 family endonuclease
LILKKQDFGLAFFIISIFGGVEQLRLKELFLKLPKLHKKDEMKPLSDISLLDFSKTYSYADYLKWEFQDRLELIKGKIFTMSPAPATRHQQISSKISNRLWNFLEYKQCQVFVAPFDVRLPIKSKKNADVGTVVQPDICVICDLYKIDSKGCLGAPDLIIEVLSPGNSKKEMKDKYEVYEESGVKEYWLVDISNECVFVYVLDKSGKYTGLKPFVKEDIIESNTLLGFSISTQDIFNTPKILK